MYRERQIALLERYFDLHTRRTTTLAPKTWRLRREAFTSDEVHRAERARVFRDRPLFLALSGDIPTPGDYATYDVCGLPVALLRGEDGVVRSLVNACRHRAMPVLEGRGRVSGRSFSCPFHAWTYDLNGRLLGQPLAQEGFADCDRELLGLRALPVEEKHGLIFVVPTDSRSDAEPVLNSSAFLGDLEPELIEFNIRAARFVEARTRTLPLNWKLVVDTFLENYHVFSLHKQSIAPRFLSTPSLIDVYGDVARFVGSRSDILGYLDKPQEEWDLLRYASIQYLLPPHGILVYQYDHWETWHVYPGSHAGECVVTTTIYAPGAEDDKPDQYYSKNLEYLIGITDPEDFGAAQKTHEGMAGGAVNEVVFGRNESLLIHFHQVIERMTNEAPPTGSPRG